MSIRQGNNAPAKFDDAPGKMYDDAENHFLSRGRNYEYAEHPEDKPKDDLIKTDARNTNAGDGDAGQTHFGERGDERYDAKAGRYRGRSNRTDHAAQASKQ